MKGAARQGLKVRARLETCRAALQHQMRVSRSCNAFDVSQAGGIASFKTRPESATGEGSLVVKFITALAFICTPFAALAQDAIPSPYGTPEHQWASPPAGSWGSTAGIERGPHGEIWAIDRCGANSCDGSDHGPIVQLDMKTGKAIKSIGAGLFVFPHGLHV